MTIARRPIPYRALCAIARFVIVRRPHFTDAEWKEAVKAMAAKQGWGDPDAPDVLARALNAVERALLRTTGFTRPTFPTRSVEPEPRPDRAWTAADYRAFAGVVRGILARETEMARAADQLNPVEAVALELSEAAALNQFYAQADVDRHQALKFFAEIAILRPADWDTAAIRRAADALRVGRECFCCRHSDRPMQRHHVIQIQHGGSNLPMNVVTLCANCHHALHPWLPAPASLRSSWTSLGDIGATSVRVPAGVRS